MDAFLKLSSSHTSTSFLKDSNPGRFLSTPTFGYVFALKKFFTSLLWWHGAPSCMNISHMWTLMWSSSSLFRKLTFSLLMVVSGAKNWSPVVPWMTSLRYHLTRGVFHCWGNVLFLVTCSNRPPNPISLHRKLLYSRLVRKMYLFPHVYVPDGMSLGEISTFFLHRLSQAWFSGWLARFEAKIQRQLRWIFWHWLLCLFPFL